MSGWKATSAKSTAVIGVLVGLIGLALYPVIIDPKLHPEKYSEWYSIHIMYHGWIW